MIVRSMRIEENRKWDVAMNLHIYIPFNTQGMRNHTQLSY
jgi:hypothetical protein